MQTALLSLMLRVLRRELAQVLLPTCYHNNTVDGMHTVHGAAITTIICPTACTHNMTMVALHTLSSTTHDSRASRTNTSSILLATTSKLLSVNLS